MRFDLPQDRANGPQPSPARFATTQWSVVLALGQQDAKAVRALEQLCRTYWLPLYSFARRQGYPPDDAKDMIQGFFHRILRANSLTTVSPEKGKFRTFLLTSLTNFLSDDRDRNRAQKRGGGQITISLDDENAEQRYLQLPASDLPAETVFDRRWAVTVLEQAFNRLREEYFSGAKRPLFEHLSEFLSSDAQASAYKEIAAKLSMTPSAVSVAVHRMRQRYRECIRLELARTIANPAELDDEMNYLFTVLSG